MQISALNVNNWLMHVSSVFSLTVYASDLLR